MFSTGRRLIQDMVSSDGTHCVGLAGARLAIGENGNIVPLNKRLDAVAQIAPNAFLKDILIEDTVEDE